MEVLRRQTSRISTSIEGRRPRRRLYRFRQLQWNDKKDIEISVNSPMLCYVFARFYVDTPTE